MLIPDLGVLADDLAELDIHIDPDEFRRAHYFGMASLDDAPLIPNAWGLRYVEGVLNGLGCEGVRRERLGAILRDARRLSDSEFWRCPVPGSAGALLELSRFGCRLAFVSNSDGTAESKLRRLGIAQVGPGEGVEVLAIIDSAVVGVAKPDPAIFDPALEAVGVDRRQAIYIGDSRAYDVEGARAAGLTPIHFDPFQLCKYRQDHHHVGHLSEVVEMVTRGGVPVS